MVLGKIYRGFLHFKEVILYESGENYLETIYILKKKYNYVRSVDLAKELNFSKPSVSRAIGILRDDGYVEIGDNGNLILTEKGLEKAKAIYERHLVLTRFLVEILHVEPKTAEADACRIEHIISEETFRKFKGFLKAN